MSFTTTQESGQGKIFLYENDTSNPVFFQTYPFGTFLKTASFTSNQNITIKNIKSQQGFYLYASGGEFYTNDITLEYTGSNPYAFFADTTLDEIKSGDTYYIATKVPNLNYYKQYTKDSLLQTKDLNQDNTTDYVCVFSGKNINGNLTSSLAKLYTVFYDALREYQDVTGSDGSYNLDVTKGIPIVYNIKTTSTNQKELLKPSLDSTDSLISFDTISTTVVNNDKAYTEAIMKDPTKIGLPTGSVLFPPPNYIS
jgi:hypothetical protein